MKKLLYVGDAVAATGYARATHEILDRVRDHFRVTVLGINYIGDPHPHPYPIYAAAAGGDPFGINRLLWMCDVVKPDVIVIQQDGWYFPSYIAKLRLRRPTGEYECPEYAAIPIVGAIAVDGKLFQGDWIKDVTHAVFWTHFAQSEARIGGYAGPSTVIPLGVERTMYFPMARQGAMERQKILPLLNKFVVGALGRNQPRKRLDLTVKYFAEWVHSRKIPDAQLFLHTAPTGDDATNVIQLARYYGVLDKLALCSPERFYGKAEEDLRDTYNCFDVYISTTQGEGMGLTAMEAMACGVPCILPDWSAYGEWAKGAAALVPCTSTALQSYSSAVTVIGGVPDQKAFVEALDLLYRDKTHRKIVAEAGRARVLEPRFRWQAIGEAWSNVLLNVVAPKAPTPAEIWQEV